MSATGFLVYYGVRYLISDPEEAALLEDMSHPKIEAANRVGLQYWWGNTPHEDSFLLIGTQIANLGWEGASHRQLEDKQLFNIMQTTKAKLLQADLNDVPALHAQFEPGA